MNDSVHEVATVVISYDPTAERIGESLKAPSYRSYLRRAHRGPVARGDRWEEFVSGGCGSRRDVTLQVEDVEGGSRIDEETEFVFRPRREP